MMPLDSNDIEHLDEHLTQFDYGDHNVQLMRDALTELKELRANDALMKLSAMLRLGEPVRPDIHANMVRQRNELRDRLSALEAENERLRADAERLRKHPFAPERCPVCSWTNINLMNYGTTGESRWMCHGCAATALSDLARVREENAALDVQLQDTQADYGALDAEAASLRAKLEEVSHCPGCDGDHL
jgi:DNA repair exonuclease SbcCD ATPase subunit